MTVDHIEEKYTTPKRADLFLKVAPFLFGAFIFAGLYLSNLYHFLLFHTIAELFSIAAAFSVFMLTWNSRRYFDNSSLQLIGIAYFFVGILDLLHTLAYKGLNIFPQYTANLPTQLWIAGRYVQSISLLVAPFFITRKLRYPVVLTVYSLISGVLLFAVFTGYFPDCFLEGSGLTPFKKISEYGIALVFLASIGHLVYRSSFFEKNLLKLLIWSLSITIVSEMMFTFYISVFGLSNLIGHYLKIIAYYLVYKAIVVNGLVKPYDLLFRDLRQSEEELKQHRAHLEEMVQERTAELMATNEELAHEINERIKTERRITVHNTLLKLFPKTASRKEYLDAVVKLIREWSGCNCVGIRIISDNGTVPYESYAGYNREFWESENHLSLRHDQCICTRVMSGKCDPQDQQTLTPFGSFHHDNIAAYVEGLADQEKTRYRGVCVKHGFSSLAVIPVYYGENIIATVHMADEREGRVSREFVAFFEDITPLIGEAIHKLDAAAERTRLVAAIESAAEAIVITDTRGMIEYVNPAFERITDFTRGETLGRDLHIIDSGKYDEKFYSEIRETLRSGKTWSGQLINKKKDGSLYHEECTIAPIKNPSGETVNYVYVKRDVSERLRLESIAEAVNTMNNIGYIFAGIRHEMGNPINSVKMALSVLKSNLGSYARTTISEYIDRSLGELSRVEYLLKSLKTFNLFESPELQQMQLRPFMEMLLALVRDDFSKRGITVSLTIAPEVEACYADPRALQQVLLNILTNASDACEGKDGAHVAITIAKVSGILQLRVEDTGGGMTEQQQEELFKPFRTTKTHGTGLGLVIAKRMLATMNGTIKITSRYGEGTAVEILIPERTGGGE